MIRNLAGGRKQVVCDTCGSEQITRDSWPALLAAMKEEHWWNRRVGDDYEHHCPACTRELAKPQPAPRKDEAPESAPLPPEFAARMKHLAQTNDLTMFMCRPTPRVASDGRRPTCRNCKHGGFTCALDGHATDADRSCRDWEDRV